MPFAPRRFTLCLVLALVAPGCAYGVQGSVGPMMSTSLRDGHQGAAMQVRAFGGAPIVGVSAALRGKVGERLGQGSFAMEGYFALPIPNVTPYLFAGLPLLQLESVDGDFVIGAFGPYAELGLAIGLGEGEGVFFTISVTAEYAARFTAPHTSGEGYLTLQLGFGAGTALSFRAAADVGRRLFLGR